MASLKNIRYPVLRKAIDEIMIIDDHAHLGLVEYYETFPVEKRIPFVTDVFKTPIECSYGWDYLRDIHYEAYEKFYGFSREELDNPSKRDELAAKYAKRRENIGDFLDVVMEEAHVEMVLTNMRMPKSLESQKNIKLIPWLDCLVLPFNNDHLKKRLLGSWYVRCNEYELQLLKEKENFQEGGFLEYLAFVDQVVENYIHAGCPGLKFLLATQRKTVFAKIDETEGPVLYEQAKAGNTESYNMLQDLLVWHIMGKAVDFDVPVQFHCAVLDNTIDYYDAYNLKNFIDDPEMQKAKIIILHGSYPSFEHANSLATAGLTPNNVYIDISGRIMFGNHPQNIAKMLRNWLDKPMLWDKILYGSDTLFGERYVYTCAKTGRDGIYLALAGMLEDEMINEDTAISIARRILRENSQKLYKL